MIEYVYGAIEPDALESEQRRAREKMRQDRQKEIFQARQRLVLPPGDENVLLQANQDLEEDAPAVHQALQALTRLSGPSVTLACLHQLADGRLCLDPENPNEVIKLEQAPQRDMIRALLRHTISVQHYAVLKFFSTQPLPEGWRNTAALRNVHPAIFRNSICAMEGSLFTLHLSRELGLSIRKEMP